MKIGILTSSRADFGVYLPLLKKLFTDTFFRTEIIAFGSHLSELYGKTVNEIIKNNIPVEHKLKTIPSNDTPFDISDSIGETIRVFAKFWNKHKFDLVFALGDRYEMFAAVSSTVAFNIKIAHIHGGETTIGAIDNSFRHAITCMSSLHFTSTTLYKRRVIEIIGSKENVYNVGALSIDAILQTELLTTNQFKKRYNIDLLKPSILITFHPETIRPDQNISQTKEMLLALDSLNYYQLVITMPNSDTNGRFIRNEIKNWSKGKKNVQIVESFGSVGYFSCMKHCRMMLGNSSSGFVEASLFSTPVINIGERQTGRILTPNIITVPIREEKIIEAVKKIEKMDSLIVLPIYGNGKAAEKIVGILKKL